MKPIRLVILVFLLVVLLGGGVFAYLLYDSVKKISAETSDFKATSHIERVFQGGTITYEGVVSITGNVTIINDGRISLADLKVSLEVYFKPSYESRYELVGTGDNVLGDVPAHTTRSFVLEINVTEKIPLLAISDGTLKIHFVINVTVSFLLSKAVEFPGDKTVEWNAPYT